MDNFLKYLLEKNILEAEKKPEDDEDYTLADEDPDVFEDDEAMEDEDTVDAAPDGINEPPSDSTPPASDAPIGGGPAPEQPVQPAPVPNKPEPEEPKKRYIGQEGDNHFYIEPKEDGFVITDQLGTEKLNSKEAGTQDELDLILAARDELKLTTWTDEVLIKYFIPKIKEKDEQAEIEFARPDLQETPEETAEEPTEEEGVEEETPEEEEQEEEDKEEDIFMEPKEKPFESKKATKIQENMVAEFEFDGAKHKIELVKDHSTKTSLFEIDGVRYQFGSDVTSDYRVEHGKFTRESLAEFGEFAFETMAEDNRPEF